MADHQKTRRRKAKKHEFESLGDFDRAMRHLADSPKEPVKKAERRAKKKKA